jgi:hypothetical protein
VKICTFKEGQFPIGVWLSPPPKMGGYKKSFVDRRYFQYAKDAGINTMYALYENFQEHKGSVEKILSICDELDLNYLPNDKAFREDAFDSMAFYSTAKCYNNHKSFVGLHIKDEPGVVFFESLKRKKDVFGKYFQRKTFYINLLPMYATPYHMLNGMWTAEDTSAVMDYETYIDSYIDILAPEFLSYDFYPCIGEFPNLEKNYFTQLSLISQKAKKADIPFWVFIQVCSFGKNVRIPSRAEILWQVNTALSFGAKGIQYFTYMTPPDNDIEQFSGAMLDTSGRINENYYYVKEANSQLLSVSSELLYAEHLGVRFSGTMPVPLGCDYYRNADISVGGESLLIGFFKGKNSRKFVYITNNSILNDSVCVLKAKTGMFERIVAAGIITLTDTEKMKILLSPGEGVCVYYS